MLYIKHFLCAIFILRKKFFYFYVKKQRLAEISSNVWGTKFTFKGKASCLPVDLGQVVYKTSLLHLQPRQMKLRLRDLTDTYCDGLGKDNHSNENFTVKVTDGWCGSDDEGIAIQIDIFLLIYL